jgi:glycine cleavage system H lipoate-binding protein/ABC-type phosphate transport system substrate-binding protein
MNSNFKAMKKIVLVLIGAAMIFQSQAGNISYTSGDLQKSPAAKGSLTITSTPDLQQLTTKWISDYAAINPKLKISFVGQNEPGTDLAFESNDPGIKAKEGSAWKMVIGRDAIIPVINSANPYLAEINARGVSAEEFSKILSNQGTQIWGTLLNGNENLPVNVYLVSDESIKSTIANFAGLDPALVKAINVATGAELIAAIQKDPNAIGFCKLADIASGNGMVSGISLLPIDKNANGKLDYIEKIYGNVDEISRGIWIGKYPQALCRNIYAVASANPTEDNQIAFLRYVLTAGQDLLETTGYNSLANSERLSKIDRLPGAFMKGQTSDKVNVIQLIITLLAGLAILAAMIVLIIRYRRINKPIGPDTDPKHLHGLNEKSLSAPKGLFFDKTHTWAFMEKDGTLKIGIDDFLQHVTGQITSIKMKKPGDTVKKGEPVMTVIQSGKRLTISSPASGIIIADNANLFSNTSLINSSPYEDGWIYRMEPTNWIRENQFLFMAEKYTEWIHNEFTRLKDFLAKAIQTGSPEYAFITLQDGGEINDNVLENLPPEVWEDFQTNFIDTSK